MMGRSFESVGRSVQNVGGEIMKKRWILIVMVAPVAAVGGCASKQVAGVLDKAASPCDEGMEEWVQITYDSNGQSHPPVITCEPLPNETEQKIQAERALLHAKP